MEKNQKNGDQIKKKIYHKFDSMIKFKTNKTLTEEIRKKNSKSKE